MIRITTPCSTAIFAEVIFTLEKEIYKEIKHNVTKGATFANNYMLLQLNLPCCTFRFVILLIIMIISNSMT